jgi:archaellum component FlaC
MRNLSDLIVKLAAKILDIDQQSCDNKCDAIDVIKLLLDKVKSSIDNHLEQLKQQDTNVAAGTREFTGITSLSTPTPSATNPFVNNNNPIISNDISDIKTYLMAIKTQLNTIKETIKDLNDVPVPREKISLISQLKPEIDSFKQDISEFFNSVESLLIDISITNTNTYVAAAASDAAASVAAAAASLTAAVDAANAALTADV